MLLAKPDLGGSTAALGLGLTLGRVFSLLVLKPCGGAWCQLTPCCASLSRGCLAQRRTQQNLPPLLVHTEPWSRWSCFLLKPPRKAETPRETLPASPTLPLHPGTPNAAGHSAAGMDALPGSPWRTGQLAHEKPRV